MKSNKELNILICGSQKFNDKSFVFGMLDAYFKVSQKFSNIVVGQYSGACEFAREWVTYINDKEKTNIGVRDFDYDMYLGHKNISLYEQIEVPEFVLQNDPFYQDGKNQILEKSIHLVLAFPNPKGELGLSTQNIISFAKLAQVAVLDCSQAMGLISNYRNEQESTVYQDKPNKSMGLNNRNPNKKV